MSESWIEKLKNKVSRQRTLSDNLSDGPPISRGSLKAPDPEPGSPVHELQMDPESDLAKALEAAAEYGVEEIPWLVLIIEQLKADLAEERKANGRLRAELHQAKRDTAEARVEVVEHARAVVMQRLVTAEKWRYDGALADFNEIIALNQPEPDRG